MGLLRKAVVIGGLAVAATAYDNNQTGLLPGSGATQGLSGEAAATAAQACARAPDLCAQAAIALAGAADRSLTTGSAPAQPTELATGWIPAQVPLPPRRPKAGQKP